jgi:peptidyl-prolyl cis-trans isomerase C
MQMRRQIEDGADFAELAAAHSECPSGKRTGGSLGWIARGTMVPAFDSALFALRDGEMSEIVETALGYHLISRIAGEAAAPADYDEVKEKVRDFLRHVRRGEALAAFVAELRDKALIEKDS